MKVKKLGASRRPSNGTGSHNAASAGNGKSSESTPAKSGRTGGGKGGSKLFGWKRSRSAKKIASESGKSIACAAEAEAEKGPAATRKIASSPVGKTVGKPKEPPKEETTETKETSKGFVKVASVEKKASRNGSSEVEESAEKTAEELEKATPEEEDIDELVTLSTAAEENESIENETIENETANENKTANRTVRSNVTLVLALCSPDPDERGCHAGRVLREAKDDVQCACLPNFDLCAPLEREFRLTTQDLVNDVASGCDDDGGPAHVRRNGDNGGENGEGLRDDGTVALEDIMYDQTGCHARCGTNRVTNEGRSWGEMLRKAMGCGDANDDEGVPNDERTSHSDAGCGNVANSETRKMRPARAPRSGGTPVPPGRRPTPAPLLA